MENITYYSNLAEKLKTNPAREHLSKEDVSDMNNLLHHIEMEDEHSWNLVYNILRCLRNSCVHCTKNQNMIINSNVLSTFEDLMEKVLSPNNSKGDSSVIAKVRVASIQFIGNLVVQNHFSQEAVWKAGFPKLFFNLMTNLDVKERDFVCMVAFNCLKNRKELYTTKDEYWFLVNVIEYCKDYYDAVWGLLIMELIIVSPSFVGFFKELNDYSGLRSSIIDLMIAHLTNDNNDDGNNSVNIPVQNLLHLCEVFATKSTCILMLATSQSLELEDEISLLLRILLLMCSVTTMVNKYDQIRKNEKFLESIVGLLKQKQSASKEKCSGENLPSQHPVIGFERDLVRVIGNMVYKNKLIQDKVRQINGIEVLLNACNIDNSNPYIMQWAVFAIKNLCEKNQTNQDYISALNRQGLAANEILGQNNLEARLENGQIKITNQVQ